MINFTDRRQSVSRQQQHLKTKEMSGKRRRPRSPLTKRGARARANLLENITTLKKKIAELQAELRAEREKQHKRENQQQLQQQMGQPIEMNDIVGKNNKATTSQDEDQLNFVARRTQKKIKVTAKNVKIAVSTPQANLSPTPAQKPKNPK